MKHEEEVSPQPDINIPITDLIKEFMDNGEINIALALTNKLKETLENQK